MLIYPNKLFLLFLNWISLLICNLNIIFCSSMLFKYIYNNLQNIQVMSRKTIHYNLLILGMLSLFIIILFACKKDNNDDNGNIDPPPVTDTGFYNDFSNDTADNWIPVDGQWFVEDNVYKVTSNNILYANTCYFDKDFSDFIFEVKARKTEGLTCNIGIAFRGDPDSVTPLGNWNSTYKLILCTDARWSIGKLVNGSYEEFEWGVSNEANTGMGEWNVLKVICANGNIDVFFNDAKQGSFYDTTFLSGKVGITMYDQYFSGKAEFDYVRLSTTLKNYTFGPIDQPEFRRKYSASSNRGDCPVYEDDENRKIE